MAMVAAAVHWAIQSLQRIHSAVECGPLAIRRLALRWITHWCGVSWAERSWNCRPQWSSRWEAFSGLLFWEYSLQLFWCLLAGRCGRLLSGRCGDSGLGPARPSLDSSRNRRRWPCLRPSNLRRCRPIYFFQLKLISHKERKIQRRYEQTGCSE